MAQAKTERFFTPHMKVSSRRSKSFHVGLIPKEFFGWARGSKRQLLAGAQPDSSDRAKHRGTGVGGEGRPSTQTESQGPLLGKRSPPQHSAEKGGADAEGL